MPINILGLRPYLDKNNRVNLREQYFVKAKSIESVFKNLNLILRDINSEEHSNLFYTAAQCNKGTREFIEQSIIPFDIDDISIQEVDSYLPEIKNALGVDLNKCIIVYTGNGIQVLVYHKPFTSTDFFKTYRKNYKYYCDRIQIAIQESGLPGKVDPSVFSSARILRLPNTLNKKPMRSFEYDNIKSATLKNYNLEDCGFSLTNEEKETKITPTYPPADIEAITNGCEFLKHAYQNRVSIAEPEWFAALGVTAFFGDNQEYSHTISRDYPGYSSEETDQKIEHILSTATGPRTCESINEVWGKCDTCPHFEKCKTPLQIKNENKILSEDINFTSIGEKGRIIRHYEDLLLAFNRDYPFKHLDDIERIITFNGKYWKTISKHKIKGYAQNKFSKPVKEHEVSEFLNLVRRTNCSPNKFLTESNTKGFINLNNGVLNLEAGTLTEHNKNYNFQYVLDYDYCPNAVCPTWDKLLSNLTMGKKHLSDVLEEYLAFCLAGGPYNPESILILSGVGANGKTSFINAAKMLAGEKNCSYFSIGSLTKDSNAAGLEGKLINFCEEEPVRVFSDTGFLKKLTGGSPIQVANKYEKPYSLFPTSKIIMTYNEIPFLKDTSKGMLRRLLIIPFELDLDKEPDKKIKNLLSKLREERSGILNNIIKAYQRFAKRNYVFPEIMENKKEIEQMIYDSDSVQAWWKDKVIVTNSDEDKISTQDLYEDFRETMEIGKESHNLSFRAFTKRIKKISEAKNILYGQFKNNTGKLVRGYSQIKIDKNIIHQEY